MASLNLEQTLKLCMQTVKEYVQSIASEKGNANIVHLTQAEYDALTSLDPNTLYIID